MESKKTERKAKGRSQREEGGRRRRKEGGTDSEGTKKEEEMEGRGDAVEEVRRQYRRHGGVRGPVWSQHSSDPLLSLS